MRKATKDRALRLGGWFAALVLPILISSHVSAQSGRRAPRTLPTAHPNKDVPDEKSGKAVWLGELKTATIVLVARQPTSKRLPTEDLIYASFVKRLNQYAGLTASAIGDLKKELVVKRAQGEAKAMVVQLRFDIDSYQEGTILINSQDLIVEYSVFAPRTGKQKSKGKVYYQGIGGGRLRKSEWPNGTPIRITPEAAGIEAAEQLYSWIAVVVGIKPR
ncbi:MAG TPA: hypothetical protein VIB00_01145 [Pyrinomonadaceae bacterium]|jgi:hypothetical protein